MLRRDCSSDFCCLLVQPFVSSCSLCSFVMNSSGFWLIISLMQATEFWWSLPSLLFWLDSAGKFKKFLVLIKASITFFCLCRVQSLKFRIEETSNLNDILLRVSAFGLFLYSVFSVIAGALNLHKDDQNLLVTITSSIAILQVVLQLLFIADVTRRRVHLPEHDRTKPGRQIVTFLLICNISMIAIYTFEAQKVIANPVS